MFPCGSRLLWRFLHNRPKDLTIYKPKKKNLCDRITMPHVGWLQANSLCHKSKRHLMGIMTEKIPRRKCGHPVFCVLFFILFFVLCFKTERCSNPLLIVRLVWVRPREIAFWWKQRLGALPKRPTEVNRLLSKLTVKSWLEPSVASKALSVLVVLKRMIKRG